jgi:broad specificity phosphatase PhoE
LSAGRLAAEMTAHLTLLCHAPTDATRSASFPADEPVSAEGLARLGRLRPMRHFDRCLTSPAERARRTAAALGLAATVEPALDECDYASWRGLSFEEVQRRAPQALAEWMQDPAKAPHGGESLDALIARVRGWMDLQLSSKGVTLAVTHASIVRAAIVVAIEAGPRSFWRIDVAPLAMAKLSGHSERWTLQALIALNAEG